MFGTFVRKSLSGEANFGADVVLILNRLCADLGAHFGADFGADFWGQYQHAKSG